MYGMLYVQSVCRGLLTINGQFCGPLEGEGQAFPIGKDAQAYLQFFPYDSQKGLATAVLELRNGRIVRLEPQVQCFALIWPDNVFQLELRPSERTDEAERLPEGAAASTLLRYLSLRIAGDDQAELLLMRQQDGIDLSSYIAAVPLRFGPVSVPDRFDERAGLVRRIAENIAVIDTALAVTVPAGQGRRMIERIEIART